MTIEEAIKRIQNELPLVEKRGELSLYAALNLGVEALKRIKNRRDLGTRWDSGKLPGETEKRTSSYIPE